VAVLGLEAAALLESLLKALYDGASEVELASAVSFAASTRIACFPTSNEFGDWDTALHTFTFANGSSRGFAAPPRPNSSAACSTRRSASTSNRFLNVPATRLPTPDPNADPARLLEELPRLLDRQQQVDEAGQLVVSYFSAAADPATPARLVRDYDFTKAVAPAASAMTSQGTARGRFTRGHSERDIRQAETAAREMGGLSLADALSLCELLAGPDPARYERAACRWLQRFIDERLPPLAEVVLAASALAEIGQGRGVGVDVLTRLLRSGRTAPR
jgi:hypothetical protein